MKGGKDMSAEAETLAEKSNYTNKDILYLRDIPVSEYDMHAAGLSAIKFRKILPPEEIAKLEAMPKEDRTVREGKWQREIPGMSAEIQDSLALIRKEFVTLNGLEPKDILSIKKDALFVIGKYPDKLKFEEFFEFRKKNEYSSYANLNGVEFYYSGISNEMDIKGIGDAARERQKDYLLKEIRKILGFAEKFPQGDRAVFVYLRNFRKKYLSRELPADCYRDMLSDECTYTIGRYSLKEISDGMKGDLDISANYINFILPLFKALL